ncbi:hypothetical protein Leucomu_03645 [Leucobacter muris]|uniref:Uncharacterized protein n=1 Tax=Leucobacter muris TaxID=1935379 RepID=A0ABX5QDJ9_9MICO|nr:hypothetical protein [Leucobacter muris]QAB17136.1 hypothetical protein Leucomu_03645 [Leucobacter muris]
MPKNRARINLRSVNTIMSNQACQSLVDEVGEEMAGVADGNYEYVSNPHRYVARGHVQTADAATARRDAETNELLRALAAVIR